MPNACHHFGIKEADGGYLTYTFTGAETVSAPHQLLGTPVFFLACFTENAAGAELLIDTTQTDGKDLYITSTAACIVRIIPLLP